MQQFSSYNDESLSSQLRSLPSDLSANDLTHSSDPANWSSASRDYHERRRIASSEAHDQHGFDTDPTSDTFRDASLVDLTELPSAAAAVSSSDSGASRLWGSSYRAAVESSSREDDFTTDDFTHFTHLDHSLHPSRQRAVDSYVDSLARETEDITLDPSSFASTLPPPSSSSSSHILSRSHLHPGGSAAATASAQRSAFFERSLSVEAEKVRRDKTRTPLSPHEVDAKQHRIRAIERRIAALRASHASKKARVAASFEAVREGYARFQTRNAEVASQGASVVRALEEAQLRLQQEDLAAAAQESQSPLELHERRLAEEGLQALPAGTLGPNPQTTIRSLHAPDLPAALLARQTSAVSAPTGPTSPPRAVEIGGLRVQAAPFTPNRPPRASASRALADAPLPPPPDLAQRLAAKAMHAMEAGEKVDRDAYALLLAASTFEERRRARKAQAVADAEAARNETHGVPRGASEARHKAWVDQHVFQASPAVAHAHAFPAPETDQAVEVEKVDGQQVTASVGGPSTTSTFRALQDEKRRYAAYLRVVKNAWASEADAAQVASLTRVDASIAATHAARQAARTKFARETSLALEAATKRRDLLVARESATREAAGRSEYRRRAAQVEALLREDPLWRADCGAQALAALKHAADRATRPTEHVWSGLPHPTSTTTTARDETTPAHHAHPKHGIHTAAFDVDAYAAALQHRSPQPSSSPSKHALAPSPGRWRDDLWERKEWSHHSDSSLDARDAAAVAAAAANALQDEDSFHDRSAGHSGRSSRTGGRPGLASSRASSQRDRESEVFRALEETLTWEPTARSPLEKGRGATTTTTSSFARRASDPAADDEEDEDESSFGSIVSTSGVARGPPSPETLRVARRRIQAAARDAHTTARLAADTARLEHDRREHRLHQLRLEREWEETRERRLRDEREREDDDAREEEEFRAATGFGVTDSYVVRVSPTAAAASSAPRDTVGIADRPAHTISLASSPAAHERDAFLRDASFHSSPPAAAVSAVAARGTSLNDLESARKLDERAVNVHTAESRTKSSGAVDQTAISGTREAERRTPSAAAPAAGSLKAADFASDSSSEDSPIHSHRSHDDATALDCDVTHVSSRGSPLLFTASRNRAVLAEHQASTGGDFARRPLHDLSIADDPESDYKHVDLTAHHHQQQQEDSAIFASRRASEVEHSVERSLDRSQQRSSALMPSSSPVGPSVPPLPFGGLPHLDPHSPSATYSEVTGAITPVSQSAFPSLPRPLASTRDTLDRSRSTSQITRDEAIESRRQVVGQEVAAGAETTGAVGTSSFDLSGVGGVGRVVDDEFTFGNSTVSLSSLGGSSFSGSRFVSPSLGVSGGRASVASSPLPLVQPSSPLHHTAAATPSADQLAAAARARTRTALEPSVHVRAPDARANSTASTEAATKIATSVPSAVAPLRPPNTSESPRHLPTTTGSTKPLPSSAPLGRTVPVHARDFDDDEFGAQFARVDDFGEVSTSRAARDRGASDLLHPPVSHRGSDVDPSEFDWDASNEAGDFESFQVLDPEGGFYDHSTTTRR